MKIVLILFLFFVGCSSNGVLLNKIEQLEKKVEQLHSAEYSGEIISADKIIFTDDTETALTTTPYRC